MLVHEARIANADGVLLLSVSVCSSQHRDSKKRFNNSVFSSSVFISSFWGFISYEFSRLHVRRGPRPMNGWRWIPVSVLFPKVLYVNLYCFSDCPWCLHCRYIDRRLQ